MTKKRVAVIGAGASGLTAIKCCLEEGLDVVCFERTNHIGGLWYYTSNAVEDQACVMKSTVINTSKEMMCFSDFPIPKDFPNSMHNSKVLEYFKMYKDHFNLEPAIRFKTEIQSVKKAADFKISGKWDLQIKDLKTSSVTDEAFDGIFVCTGHHASKNLPEFPGLQDFKGKTVHTQDYKDHVGYENKRVVVIGIGNSGGDVAVELGRICKQDYLSTRRGSWVFNRVAENGLPADMLISPRINGVMFNILPHNWINKMIESKVNQRFDHSLYGLRPEHHVLSQHPTVNDDLPNRIICGSVVIKPNIKKITVNGVEFDDGSFVDEIDVIIFATGYKFGFPFIDKDVIDVNENCVDLYKYVYPPDLEHPTIAIIGCVQPLGSTIPISEMQCRWAVQLLQVCFERTNHIGGLWYYTSDPVEDQACVMKSTVINTSKEMMCYSDFPIPKEFPNYMHNSKVFEYFKMYKEHFNLEHAIRFKTEIQSVKKAADFKTNGKWDLQVKDLTISSISNEVFDSVFVCTGHHAEKNLPEFPGLEDFKGKTVHTHDYKDHVGYENKRVVVVGIGNSGGDVAVELGRICKQVYLSTRRGSWVLNRVAENGLPADMVNARRILGIIRRVLPYNWFNKMIESRVNHRFDHSLYGLRPKHHVLSQHPTVNDDLPNRIICGSVAIKPNAKKITATWVEFEDGSFVDDIDAIIFATGYKFGFPFIGEDIIDVKENCVDLYKYVYPPDLEQPTMAVIGCIQPWGAIMPISEMQCRWAVQLWQGHAELPSQELMLKDIKSKQDAMAKRYVKSQRHTIQVDYIPYMDELAENIGCKPNIRKLLQSDPVLGWKCFTEPATPYQYRIHGPHPWAGAREAIMTQWDRVFYALQTRKPADQDPSSGLVRVIAFVILAIIVAYMFL